MSNGAQASKLKTIYAVKPGLSSVAGSAQVPPRHTHAHTDLLRLSEVHLMELAGVQPLFTEAITLLLRHRSEHVQATAARNARLDRLSELYLARDRDSLVRAALALNAWLCANAQRVMSGDVSELVRMRLAMNRHISSLTRNVLAQDGSSRVRSQMEKYHAVLSLEKTEAAH